MSTSSAVMLQEAAIRQAMRKKAAYQQGAENLKKPHIKTYIDERLEAPTRAKIADQTEVPPMTTGYEAERPQLRLLS